MTDEQKEGLKDIQNSLLSLQQIVKEQVKDVEARAIIKMELFILLQKTRYVLGEKDE